MRCENPHCREGMVKVEMLPTLHVIVPCPDCLGGADYCCDGLREQPDPEQQNAASG